MNGLCKSPEEVKNSIVKMTGAEDFAVANIVDCRLGSECQFFSKFFETSFDAEASGGRASPSTPIYLYL